MGEGDRADFRLLFVDDEKSILTSLKRTFARQGYTLATEENGEDALALMDRETISAAVIDLKMPGMDGLTLLTEIKKRHPTVRVVMLTAHGNVQDAVKAVKSGADDFIEKPFVPESLTARVRRLYELWSLARENQRLKTEIGFRFHYDKLIGSSPAMLQLKSEISQIGPSDVTVLVQGETGTGKELAAKAIHAHSPRAGKDFVAVDCAAINESILESELFGHAKGAFTGAHTAAVGLVRSADKGTLFFDEIGELPPSLQSKFLRVLQEREVRPVGSTRPHPVDVRVIAATNRDLREEVARGRFREDLYYRLETITLQIPPLRERMDDISELACYFLSKYGTDFSQVQSFSRTAMAAMEVYSWPGNVRELENVIRRAMALGQSPIVQEFDLPPQITGAAGHFFAAGLRPLGPGFRHPVIFLRFRVQPGP
jgi:DNA-binding NtrC family response regulator